MDIRTKQFLTFLTLAITFVGMVYGATIIGPSGISSTSDGNFSRVFVNGTDVNDLIGSGYPQQPPSYIVWVSGGIYYSKNCITGSIDFSGANFVTVFQNTIDNLLAGTIYIKSGTYTYASNITIDDRKVIIGEGQRNTVLQRTGNGATIVLKSGVAWTESIILEKLTIDGNSKTGTALSVESPRSVSIKNINVLNSKGIGARVIDGSYGVIIDQCSFGANNIGIQIEANHVILSNSRATSNNETNIKIVSNGNNIIVENCVIETVQNAGAYNMQIVGGDSEDKAGHLIKGNRFEDAPAGGGNILIYNQVASEITGVRIIANWFSENNLCINVTEALDTEIRENFFTGVGTAINIESTGISTQVFDNTYDITTKLSDSGTDTVLPSVTLIFINGTEALLSNFGQPFGYKIDAVDEAAVTYGIIPYEAEEVRSIKIYGAAKQAPGAGNGMQLHILAKAGSLNAAYQQESIDVENVTSVDLGVAINDIIHWEITTLDDVDVDDIAGGYVVQVQILGEHSDGADVSTKLVATSVVIEYID